MAILIESAKPWAVSEDTSHVRVISRLMRVRSELASTPSRISFDQIWYDRTGIFYFEIRPKSPPMITTGNKTVLDDEGIREIEALIDSLK